MYTEEDLLKIISNILKNVTSFHVEFLKHIFSWHNIKTIYC